MRNGGRNNEGGSHIDPACNPRAGGKSSTYHAWWSGTATLEIVASGRSRDVGRLGIRRLVGLEMM